MKDIIIQEMIKRNIIPKEGIFIITQEHINSFYEIYGSLNTKKGTKLSKSNISYAKKLAGINLMKLNLERGKKTEYNEFKIRTEKPKCGIIYLISNPAFPDNYKIGITRDLGKRLNTYQTGDPNRGYKVEHYKFVEDIREEEKNFLNKFNTDIVKGEWINNNKVKEIFLS